MNVRLVTLSPAVFETLAAGDRVTAEKLTGLSMSAWFADRIEIWDYMLTLLDDPPDNAEWLMQAVVLGADEVIGNAGFKGHPVGGQIELGYSIAPQHRRRGHASTVVGLLLERGRDDPRIERVIARIHPANAPSIGVVTKAGFVPDGEFVSPRSGRQLQFVHPTDIRGG